MTTPDKGTDSSDDVPFTATEPATHLDVDTLVSMRRPDALVEEGTAVFAVAARVGMVTTQHLQYEATAVLYLSTDWDAVERFFEHEPQVGVIGDAYEVEEVGRYVAAALEIQGSYPESDLVIVPKCRSAIHAIPDDLVVGYSRGYADRLAHEFSEPRDWRGRRVHILGGSPPKQLNVIMQLTRPTLTEDPPADIVGLDWNGLYRGAQFGEFWTAGGWDDSGRDAEHMTIRKTVRCSLAKVREFWQARGVWPESTTKEDSVEFEYRGPSPSDIESAACTDRD